MSGNMLIRLITGLCLFGLLMCLLLVYLATGVGDYIVAFINTVTFSLSLYTFRKLLK